MFFLDISKNQANEAKRELSLLGDMDDLSEEDLATMNKWTPSSNSEEAHLRECVAELRKLRRKKKNAGR